jgi:hypothetical protein
MKTQTELSGEEEITKALEAMAANKNQNENPVIEEQASKDTDEVVIVDNEEKSEETDTSKLNDIEKEAYDIGWRPKSEFLKAGHDPDSWTSARAYISFRNLQKANKDLQDRVSTIEEDSAKRFENLNKFHKARNDFEIKEREKKLLEAVSNADTDEYARLNGEIEALKNDGKVFVEPVVQKQVQQSAPQLPPIIAEWREKNSWIKDANDPRSISANAIWDNYVKVNGGDGKVTIEECLKHTETQLKKLGIIEGEKVNPMRTSASSVESSRSPTKKTGQTVISMATIPHEMRRMWENTKNSGMWKNEKEFLQSYADSLNQNNRR